MKSEYQRKKYELEILTPLLIHGNLKEVPELRVSSIKGMMHYWWRALQYASNMTDLRENEEKIFGGTIVKNKNKNGKTTIGKKSPVSIRILKSLSSNEIIKENVLSHRDHPKYDGSHSGGPKIYGFRNGTKFSLVFIAPASESKSLDTNSSLFELSCMVGGFGQRARRGYGSIQLSNQSWTDTDHFLHSVKEKMISINHELESTVQIEGNILTIAKEKYEKCSYPVIKKIYIGKTPPFGNTASTYKSIPQLIGMASHRFNKRNNKRKNIGNNSNSRLASPLHASVVKIGGQLVPVVTEVHNPNAHTNTEHDINDFISFIQKGGNL